MSRAQAATASAAVASPVLVLIAPQSSHTHSQGSCQALMLIMFGPFPGSVTSQGWVANVLPPSLSATTSHYREYIQHLSLLICMMAAPSLTAPIPALRGIPGREKKTLHVIFQPGRTNQHHLQ